MGQRLLFRVEVEACAEEQKLLPRSDREVRRYAVLYAGSFDLMSSQIESAGWANRLEVMRIVSVDRLEKANGRQGPGVLSFEAI